MPEVISLNHLNSHLSRVRNRLLRRDVQRAYDRAIANEILDPDSVFRTFGGTPLQTMEDVANLPDGDNDIHLYDGFGEIGYPDYEINATIQVNGEHPLIRDIRERQRRERERAADIGNRMYAQQYQSTHEANVRAHNDRLANQGEEQRRAEALARDDRTARGESVPRFFNIGSMVPRVRERREEIPLAERIASRAARTREISAAAAARAAARAAAAAEARERGASGRRRTRRKRKQRRRYKGKKRTVRSKKKTKQPTRRRGRGGRKRRL